MSQFQEHVQSKPGEFHRYICAWEKLEGGSSYWSLVTRRWWFKPKIGGAWSNLTHIISNGVAQPPTRPRLLAMFDEWRSGTSRTWSRIWRHYPHCPWEKPWVFWQGDFGWMGKKSNEGGVCFLLFLMGLMDVVVFFVFVFWGEGGCTYQIQRNQDGRSDLERQRTRTEVLRGCFP